MDFGIATVVAITVMCYIVGLIVRATGLDNKWIPVTCGVAGLLLGIAALYIGMAGFPGRRPDYCRRSWCGVWAGRYRRKSGIQAAFRQIGIKLSPSRSFGCWEGDFCFVQGPLSSWGGIPPHEVACFKSSPRRGRRQTRSYFFQRFNSRPFAGAMGSNHPEIPDSSVH